MRDLLVIVPSRGRPGRLAESLRAGLALSEAETYFAVGYDRDDPFCEAYEALSKDFAGQRVFWQSGPRNTLSGWTNHLASHYQGRAARLASFGDDHVARTQGWDAKLLAAIDGMGGSGFAYPNDLQRPDIPEAVVVSADIVQALGWFCLPELRHWAVDNVWHDLGMGIGRLKFCSDIVVEHMHWSRGLTPRDYTYRQAGRITGQDLRAYSRWCATRREADIATIKRALGL